MSAIESVLVPTDFSGGASRAVARGIDLAKRLQVPLHLIHVVPWILYEHMAQQEVLGRRLDDTTWLLERGGDQLLEPLGSAQEAGVDVHTRTTLGAPAREICKLAAELDNPLIVLSSHGETGARSNQLGRVAMKTMRAAPGSVWLEPATSAFGDGPDLTPIQSLVVGVDFSDASQAAVDFALRVAPALECSVRLVHAVSPPSPNFEPLYGTALAVDREQYREHVESKLESLGAPFWKAKVPFSSVVAEGAPAQTLIRLAGDTKDPLIALGPTGHGWMERILLGTTAERVVRALPAPVVVCRPGG